MKSLTVALDRQHIRLTVSDCALVASLALMGFTPKYGARPLSGVIRTQLRRPLSKKIISGALLPGQTVQVDLDKQGELAWKIE